MPFCLENMQSIENWICIFKNQCSLIWIYKNQNVLILINVLSIKGILELYLCIPELSTSNLELNIPTYKMRGFSMHVKALFFYLFLHVPTLHTIEKELAHVPSTTQL